MGMLRVRPVSTILTSFDQPLVVDVEADPVPATLEVYLPDQTLPYTSITLNQRYSRITVWSTNPIASSPTNQIYTIRFELAETGERLAINIAYYSTTNREIVLQPERGTVLYTRITRTMIINDRLFYDTGGGNRIRLLNAPEHNKAFIEVYGENELGDKFYYVDRQDRILTEMGASTTLNVTLKAFKGYVPVAIYYDIPALGTFYRLSVMARSYLPGVVSDFLADVGARISEMPIATARQISRLLGLNLNILGATVEEGRLKVIYAVDAPPLLLLAFGLVAGAVIGMYLSGAIRDIRALAETYRILNTLDLLAQERTRAILKVLEYAQARGLTFEQTRELVNNIIEQYDSQDVVNALESRNTITELEAEVSNLKTQRLLLGATAIGAGALAVLALRSRS